MVFTNSLDTFTETIRTQKQKDFWRESGNFQRFSPEAPLDATDLISSAPPGTFDDADETPEPYRCTGKDPYHGTDDEAIKCESEEKAIEYAKANGYQLINKFKTGKIYWFKCPLNSGKTYEDIIDHIENNLLGQTRPTLLSIVIKLD